MSRISLQLSTFRTPLLVFMTAIVLLEFPGARDLVQTPYSGIQTLNLAVQNIDRSGPNADVDIRRDDEIIAVGEARVRNYNQLRHIVMSNKGHTPQRYTFERDGQLIERTVSYAPAPSSFIYRRFGLLLVAFTFLLTGLLVLLRRSDPVGILFSANCTLFAYILTDRPVAPFGWLQLCWEILDDAVILVLPVVFLHFFLVFPERPPHLDHRRRRRWLFLLYAPAFLLLASSAGFAIRNFLFEPTGLGAQDVIRKVSGFYWVGYLVASLVVFVRSYRKSSVAQRRKLGIAIAGTVVGIVPLVSMTLWRQFSPGSYTLWEFASVIALAFVSISFAYAILKHGAIELNIVVRKSLAYAFLTGAIIAAYYMLVNLIGEYLTTEFNLNRTYFSVATILVLAIVFAPARDIFQRVIDRVFFRAEYHYEREVVEFSRQLGKKLKKSEILDHFSDRMRELLKASFVAFYEHRLDNHDWVRCRVDGEAASLPSLFPKASLLGRYLCRYKKPLMVEYLDYSWGKRHLDDTSATFLKSSGAAVCVPLTSGESLCGLIVLGPKRSGLIYDRTDSRLIERFVEHLALVLENADLHEASIEQERLKSEVLLAREIQLSLLPKASPEHRALRIHGQMVSSKEVGGDYFDYFSLETNRIGLAVGDVRGKGIPAAMLMSSLQAVFKNLALRDKMGPSEVVRELNRFLCGNGEAGQIATFFYGIADLDEGTLIFSNAGHCPGLLIKRDYVDRLGEGGLLLGADPESEYREGSVRLESGDMLCLYSDGLTEQSDSSGQLFGEQRLIDFLGANKNLPIEKMQEALYARILEYGSGRQDDDFTSIIALHNGS